MGETRGRRGAILIHASDIQKTKNSGRAPGQAGGRYKTNDTTKEEATAAPPGKAVRVGGAVTRQTRLLGSRQTEAQPRTSQLQPSSSCERQTRSATPCKQDDDSIVNNARKRKGSINLQVRRPTTEPDLSNLPSQRENRTNARRTSTLPVAGPVAALNATPPTARRASAAIPTVAEVKEQEPALTSEQKAAFKEAFDLFDSNGGGTIDSEELAEALNSVDIYLSVDEIKEVLQAIDKDGSGEIDFEEFLNIMTNTEKFLEMFASKHEGLIERSSIQGHVLFDALTQFMKSSALKQMDEIVRYYKCKYRRVNAPHVVMHYAAGARLIGLTEKQLARHLQALQASNQGNDLKSPYAQPLHIFLTGPPAKTVTKKAPSRGHEQRRQCTGKIRLTISLPPSGDATLKEDEQLEHEKIVQNSKHANTNLKPVFKPRLGWVKPHVKSIAARLPQRRSVLTTEDLASIRKRITDATRDHYDDLARNRVDENERYWRSLQPQFIPSKTLRTNFRRVFCAYVGAGQRKI